jgi:molybdenum cofactor biosynthesis enzyme MoaA
VWQCNAKHRRQTACRTPALRSEEIQESFVQAVNRIIENKADIIRTCEAVLSESCSIKALTAECNALQAELEVIAGLMQQHINAYAHMTMDQIEYQQHYDDYETRYRATHEKIDQINKQREALVAKHGQVKNYLETLTSQEIITEFDESLFYGTVNQIRVTSDGKIKFIFKDGTEIIM